MADRDDGDRRGQRKWLMPAVVGVAILGLVGLLIAFLRSAPSPSKPPPFIETMNVRVVPLPPPPPPPPPPPTPKKTLEEIKEKDLAAPSPEVPNQPKSAAPKLAAPPGPLQTNGPLGNDAFGLGQGDGGGGGGGGGGRGYGGFVSAVQEKLQLALSRDDKLKYEKYRVRVSLWLSDDGRPERCKLIDSTGNTAMDTAFCHDAESVVVYAPPPSDHRGQAITVLLKGSRSG